MPAKRTKMGPLSLSLPATSANLGPAFDAAALAFDLTLELVARPAKRFTILARGRDTAICGQVENNLILNTYSEVLRQHGQEAPPLALRIRNSMPIGKGCGSSAAARLAGIACAVHFGVLPWDDQQIVAEASRREHHPDNAAACWFGGVAVARMDDNRVHAIKILPKGNWPLLLAVPEEKLATEEARAVLPLRYSRADTVSNIQNSMLLLAAFTQGRQDLLGAALEDRIHQPYRSPLCPLLPALKPLAGQNGVLGVVLSGAGPSVLLFLDPAEPLASVRRRVTGRLQDQGLSAELLATSISNRGAIQRRV